jgi:flagellar biosynthesis chaperone FliJ
MGIGLALLRLDFFIMVIKQTVQQQKKTIHELTLFFEQRLRSWHPGRFIDFD